MEVDVGGYTPGGVVVTDLLNTRAGFSAGDRLTTTTELHTFLVDHDLVGAGRPTRADVEELRALRGELARIVDLDAGGAILDALNHLLDHSPHRLALHPAPTGSALRWKVTTTDQATCSQQVRLLAAVSLLGVVHALGYGRLRSCASDTCTGMFIDTSTNGRRRFCTPSRCGNRTNVAQHRARQRNAR